MSTPGVGAAQEYIEGVFGGPTEETDGVISISTTPTKIVGNDPEALAIALFNIGSNTVYLMYDNDVSSSRGMIMNSSGGGYGFNVRDDQTLPTRAWWAVTTSGTSDVLYVRTRRYNYTYTPPVVRLKPRVITIAPGQS